MRKKILVLVFILFAQSFIFSQVSRFRATHSTIKLEESTWEEWGKIDRLITFDESKGIVKIHSEPSLKFYITGSEYDDKSFTYYCVDENNKKMYILVEDFANVLAMYFVYDDFILAFRGNFID